MDGFRVEIFSAREKRTAAVVAAALVLLLGSAAWALRGNAPSAAPPAAAGSSLQRFAAFTFVSGTEAYAVAGTSEHPNNELESLAKVSAYRTADGARSWRRLRMPTGASGLPLSLQAVPGGGGVLMTVGDPVGATPSSFWFSPDGGASWRPFLTPTPVRGAYVTLLNPRTAYLVSPQDSLSAALAIYWTQDGGASWRRTVALDPSDPSAGDFHIDGPYIGPAFSSPQVGWIMSGSFVPRPGGIRPLLLRTVDAGATWREVPIPAAPDKSFTLSVPEFPDGGPHGFLALGGAAGMLIYETHDGGATWAPPYQTGVPWLEAAPDRWVYSAGRSVEISSDWGRTWTTVDAHLPLGLALGHVEPRGSVLWSFPYGDATGDSAGPRPALMRSTDGGSGWSRMKWPGG